MFLVLTSFAHKVKRIPLTLFYSIRSKASRAKKLLQKKAIEKERKKAEAVASGIDWLSDDSDDEPQVICLVLSTFTSRTIFFMIMH